MVRKTIQEIIEIPEGMAAEIDGGMIKLKKGSEEVGRKLVYDVKKEDNKLVIKCEDATKKKKRLIKTEAAHIKGMISGLKEKYEYKLQICSVHFPMSVSISGNVVSVKNFLGETKERKAKIVPGVEVKIEKDIITVRGSDKEKTGQTAANIEKATRIRNRDRRVFQDGIYITEKEKGAKRK